jgi:antitoxin component of RelBE/YafQ-DinJ toxin-antitoxin module
MAGSKIFPLRLTAETKTRWQAAADGEGLPLSEFIRMGVERLIAGLESAEPVEATMKPLREKKPPEQSVTMPGGKVFKGPDPKGGKK